MLAGQMSLWQLESVQDGPRNLPVQFGHTGASKSWNIANIELVWFGVCGDGKWWLWWYKVLQWFAELTKV